MSLNPVVEKIIRERMHKGSDQAGYRINSYVDDIDRRSMNSRDYADGYSDGYREGRRDQAYDMAEDSRRRSSTTGRFMSDGHDEIRLHDENIEAWKHRLVNNNGMKGPRFGMNEVMSIAKRCGITFDNFTKEEFCMAMNMCYSDSCKTNSAYIPADKELEYYACLAKEWLEDKDGPTPGEKLAGYYYVVSPTIP